MPGLLEGSVLTETVFAWPGLGLYITNSLQNADMNAVLGGTIVIGSVFIAINILSDLLYRTLDPTDARAMSQSSLQTSPMTRRQWLMSDRPQSRLQARLGRAYMTWLRFSANRLAVAGLCIILMLILVAIFADVLAPHSPVIGDLGGAAAFAAGQPRLSARD